MNARPRSSTSFIRFPTGAGGEHDTYRSALTAHPAGSQGRSRGDLEKPGRKPCDLIYCGVGRTEDRMVWQVGMFDVEDRLAGLSKKGDPLERLQAVVDFEVFRPELERAVPRADQSKGGRPLFDHVLMFKDPILQTQNNK
jgi:hypothetical protein